MGSLIPINGGADAEIKTSLNSAFNDTNIFIVKDVIAKENLFDGDHHLHRVAYRLGAYPIRTYPNDDAKGKWFYFLKKILKDAKHNGVSTTNSIRSILLYAVSNAGASVARVTFDAQTGADPNADHYVDAPNGGNPIADADIAPLVDITGTLNIALICPSPLPNKSSPIPNQTGDLDKDTHGNIIERPPIKIFTPALLAPRRLSRKTRKPLK